MTGRAPLSPLRTREIQILTYSPSESAMTSGAARATSDANLLVGFGGLGWRLLDVSAHWSSLLRARLK